MNIKKEFGIIVLTADEGYTIKSKDGFLSKQFWLGCNDTPDNYEEISLSEIENESEEL